MPSFHAISLNYDHTADIFRIKRDLTTKADTSACLFQCLARQSSVFNQLLLEIRHGFRTKLYSYKGEESTTLYNASVRQSTKQELYESSRRLNGQSSYTLHHLAANLEDYKADRVTASNLSLADYIDEKGLERTPHLKAGFTLEFDQMDDFDTYHYQTIVDHSREKILKYQLADFANEHQGEPCEFIIIMDDKREISAFLKSEVEKLPSNMTIKLVEFNWHKAILNQLGTVTIDKLKLINKALFHLDAFEKKSGLFADNSQPLKAVIKQLIPIASPGEFHDMLNAFYTNPAIDKSDIVGLRHTLASLSDQLIGDKEYDIAQKAFSSFELVETVQGKETVQNSPSV